MDGPEGRQIPPSPFSPLLAIPAPRGVDAVAVGYRRRRGPRPSRRRGHRGTWCISSVSELFFNLLQCVGQT